MKKKSSIIGLGRFHTWYKSRQFFPLLFQLLPIISFVAPPLSKSHVVLAHDLVQKCINVIIMSLVWHCQYKRNGYRHRCSVRGMCSMDISSCVGNLFQYCNSHSTVITVINMTAMLTKYRNVYFDNYDDSRHNYCQMHILLCPTLPYHHSLLACIILYH